MNEANKTQFNLRTEIVLRGKIEEESRDFKTILEMKKMAKMLKVMAEQYTERRFDMVDTTPQEGEVTLLLTYNSPKAIRRAECLVELMEKVEKEAREFYEEITVRVNDPTGKIEGHLLHIH